MARPQFPYTPRPDASTLQQHAVDAFERLGDIAEGRSLGRVSVGAAETKIPHGLGAIPSQTLVTPTADARVWESREPDAVFVYLTASVAVVCRVTVF